MKGAKSMHDGYFYNTERAPLHVNSTQWSVDYFVAIAIRLIIVAVFVWAAIVLVNMFVKYLNKHSRSEISPLDTAKKRLASGEITTDEFEELKKHLK